MSELKKYNYLESKAQNITFLEFERIMRSKIEFTNNQHFDENTLGETDFIASISNIKVPLSNNQINYSNVDLFMNMSWFPMTEKHREELIQTTVTHEIVEAWELIYLKYLLGNFNAEGRTLAHNTALLHEFNFAFNHNCHKEYLRLTKRWSTIIGGSEGEIFRKENLDAYRTVVEKKWRPRPSYYTTPLKKLIPEKLLVVQKPFSTFPESNKFWGY